MAGTTVPEIYCWKIHIEDLIIYLASTKKGAARIGLSMERQCDCIDFFKGIYPNSTLLENHRLNRPLIQNIEAVFHNNPAKKPVDFDFRCTRFQWLVYKAVSRIPFGETRSYGEVASMIGNPKSAQAVGQALGKNPLPLIFP